MTDEKPTELDVSIVLSTRDRAPVLADTLSALAARLRAAPLRDPGHRQRESGRHAAVLADAKDCLPLIALHEAVPGKNRAVNGALERVRGHLIIFTDDDICPEPGWARAMVAAAARWPDADVFAGVVRPMYPAETPEWLRAHHFARAAFSLFDHPLAEGPLPRRCCPSARTTRSGPA